MKKRYSFALLTLSATLLSSCGFNVLNKADFDNYIKDGALRELNSNNLFFDKHEKYDIELEPFEDFYKIGKNEYKSFFSDNVISSTGLKSFKIGNHSIYYDKIHTDVFYDSFGDEIEYLRVSPTNAPITTEFKIIAAECSSFYRKVSGIKSNSQKLHIIDATKVSLESDAVSNSGYILKEEGDTHFRARNYWLDLSDLGKKAFDFDNRELCLPADAKIEKIDDYEFLVNGHKRYKYSLPTGYSDFEYSSAVAIENEKSRSASPTKGNVKNLLTIRLAGNNNLYQYFLAEYEQGNRPETFSYVENGKYYQAFIIKDEYEYPVDYVPVLDKDGKPKYKVSPDNSNFYIEVRKIKDKIIDIIDADSYMINIDNNFERSQFYQDTSFLDDETKHYYFHDTYHEYPLNYEIDSLNKEALVLKNKNNNYVFINNKGGIYYRDEYRDLVNTYFSLNHYYSFFSETRRALLIYDAKNNFEIDPIIIGTSKYGFKEPPSKGDQDYIFNMVATTLLTTFVNRNCVKVNVQKGCKTFGETRLSFVFSSSLTKADGSKVDQFGHYITYKN